MKLSDIFVLVYDVLMLASVAVLIWQSILLRKTQEATILDNMYSRYLEFDRLLVEKPHLQKYAVRGELAAILSTMPNDQLERRAFIELILDRYELMFLKDRAGQYRVERGFLERLLSNPFVKEYWTGSRGRFKKSFEQEVDAILSRMRHSE
jgi:hypothetical protein